ncbi:hypothetical protein O1L60_16030 [Streptomyces diastatochromogenes]|nr:hypothetical protein [Streptomyces diastatochromogenes]
MTRTKRILIGVLLAAAAVAVAVVASPADPDVTAAPPTKDVPVVGTDNIHAT